MHSKHVMTEVGLQLLSFSFDKDQCYLVSLRLVHFLANLCCIHGGEAPDYTLKSVFNELESGITIFVDARASTFCITRGAGVCLQVSSSAIARNEQNFFYIRQNEWRSLFIGRESDARFGIVEERLE